MPIESQTTLVQPHPSPDLVGLQKQIVSSAIVKIITDVNSIRKVL